MKLEKLDVIGIIIIASGLGLVGIALVFSWSSLVVVFSVYPLIACGIGVLVFSAIQKKKHQKLFDQTQDPSNYEPSILDKTDTSNSKSGSRKCKVCGTTLSGEEKKCPVCGEIFG